MTTIHLHFQTYSTKKLIIKHKNYIRCPSWKSFVTCRAIIEIVFWSKIDVLFQMNTLHKSPWQMVQRQKTMKKIAFVHIRIIFVSHLIKAYKEPCQILRVFESGQCKNRLDGFQKCTQHNCLDMITQLTSV